VLFPILIRPFPSGLLFLQGKAVSSLQSLGLAIDCLWEMELGGAILSEFFTKADAVLSPSPLLDTSMLGARPPPAY